MFNNYFPYPNQYSPAPVEIPHVNGQNGAQAYQLPCNSSVLLLDDNSPIVYLLKTDSAGYKTVTPYSISEYKPKPTIDAESLLERIENLERRIYESDFTKFREENHSSGRQSKVLDEYDSPRKQSNRGDEQASRKQS